MAIEKLFEDGLYRLTAAMRDKSAAEKQAEVRHARGVFFRIEQDGHWWGVWDKVHEKDSTK